MQKKLSAALTEPIESLLEAGGKDSWASIRNLLKRETETAASELSSAIVGFELDQETVKTMVQNLRDYARNVVEKKAREEAGNIIFIKYIIIYSLYTIYVLLWLLYICVLLHIIYVYYCVQHVSIY